MRPAIVPILTLAELEVTTCLRLSRLLTLNLTCIACEEALCLESLLVLGINLNECAGNGKTQSLALACEAATVESSLDVVLAFCFEQLKGLLDNILKDCRWEVFLQFHLIYNNLAGSLCEVNTSYRALAASNCVYLFHLLVLFVLVNINCLGLLSLVLVLGAVVNVEIAEQLATERTLRQHTSHCVTDDALHAVGMLAQLCGGVETLTAGITSVAGVDLVGLLLASEISFLGIDDDNVVSTVYVGSEVWLVLSADELCHFRGQTAYNLVGSIYYYPLFLGCLLVGGNSLVT